MIKYKFREDELINEFKSYIDKTYSGHYNTGTIQSSEVIVDRGHGAGFFHGNIDKYNGRYGKKGETPDEWRKDIVKIIHYGFLALYEHDRVYSKEDTINLSDITLDANDTTLTITPVDFGGAMAAEISMYNDDLMVYNIQTANQSNKDEK